MIEQSRATWLIVSCCETLPVSTFNNRVSTLQEQKLHQEVQTPLRTRKRKLDVPELEPEVGPESTPFLCNIVQPAQRNITLGMSLAFPSPKCIDASSMEITQMDMDMTKPKQGKRPRYSLFPKPVQTVRTDAEVVSVLQTPPIRRSRPSISEADSISRPSSILKDKMRRFMNFSTFEGSQHPISDGDRSESETDMEVSAADTSAKHLRFTLPTQTVSPPTSESEIVEVVHEESEDMELVEETQHQSLAAEDSQFLSFEEEKEPPLQAPVEEPALPVEEEKLPALQVPLERFVEEVAPVLYPVVPQVMEEAKVQVDIEDSNDGMELTNLEATTLPPAVHFMPEMEKEEPPTTLEVLVPVKQPIPPSQDESDESDIVCLDSSSEEEADSDAVDKEDVEEEEEVEEEEVEEEEVEDESEVGATESEGDIEEVEDDSDEKEAKEEGEAELAKESEPIPFEPEIGAQRGEFHVEFEELSEQEYVFLPPYVIPTEPTPIEEAPQAKSDDIQELEPAQQSHYDAKPDSCNVEEDSLEEETKSSSSDKEDESEADDEEEDQKVSQGSDEDSSREKFSLTGHQTMSTSYKQRFTMSSSEDDSSDMDDRVLEIAAMRGPPVTGYSAVEPDFDSVSDVAPSLDAPMAKSLQVSVVEEEEEPVQQALMLSGYSEVEPDLEDMEEDAGQQESAGCLYAPQSPIDDGESSVNVTSGEEEQEEQFELKLTDTPSSAVARRSSHRRRFSMSSLVSSGEEGDQTEEQHVKEPEISPYLDRTEQPDSSSDQEGRRRMRTGRSSMFIKVCSLAVYFQLGTNSIFSLNPID